MALKTNDPQLPLFLDSAGRARDGKGRYAAARSASKASEGRRLLSGDTNVAMDAFRNAAARMGTATPSLADATEYVLERWSNDYWLMITLYRNHWIARRGIDGPAHDMTKAWAKMQGTMTPEDMALVDRAIFKTQTPARIRKGIKWGRLFGGAGALMVLDGHENHLEEPLDVDDVMPGQYKGLIVFDRWSGITPGLEVCTDINNPIDYGLPEFYDVRPAGSEADGGFRVHCSRILRFTGPEVPSPEFEAQQRWGISVLEIVFDELKKRDNASYTILNLMFRANILAQVNPDLAGMQSGAMAGGAAAKKYYETMQAQNELLSNQSMLLLGKDGKLETHQMSFAGLGDIYAQFQMDIAGAFETTVTRLFGRTISGLGQTNDADEQQHEDRIAEKQVEELKPQLEKLYPVVCMSTIGEVPDDLDLVFPSVRKMTEKEKAELAKDGTEAIMAPYNAGIRGYGSKTILKEIRKMSDVTGIGTSITDEMIEAAPDDDAIPGEGNGPELPQIEEGPEGEGGEKDAPEGGKGEDAWNESEHPRARNGEFGAGGGGGSEKLASVTVKARPAFVSTFVEQHTTIGGQKAYLKTASTEKLKTAKRLVEGHIDPASNHVRDLVNAELKERGSDAAPNRWEALGRAFAKFMDA